MASTSCPICCETRKKSSLIHCSKCSFECCKSCVKKFLLGSPSINPTCMNCKNTWDFDFLAKNTDEPFHNHEYREYRAKIIIQRERSLLPATQPYVESVRVQEEKKKQGK